ncbi:MAG: diacylglycerol kinase family lipid kinase [candidate division KSB1 bacterium]|nr:diacylglycerol kinase family lipid kinase [candidate division KSB1 bacterium]MDZ7358860.1 diacylglycerol kinase family lipid kinase [candidate division KSB1 bacterium]MDZ7400128.1 diacylglycerol kinase family lipid kinase [candidate division KSB1 bacterium]
MKILLILNPVAGKNKGIAALQRADLFLKKHDISYDLLVSEFAGHAIQLAQQVEPSKYDGIVAVGGDGTLFEVVNGLLKQHSNLAIPIGQIPVGTGNSFIRDLAIHSIEDAVAKIAAGRTKKVDVGWFRHPEGEHYFINLLGTGFVANVAHRAKKYKALGAASYVLGVFEEVALLKSLPTEIIIDGKVYHRDAIFIEICNSTKTGGNMIMAPNAKIDDGFLDIILLNKISRTKLLTIFPQIFKGTHVNESCVETFRGRQIKVASEPAQKLTPDGEVFGTTPIEVSIFPSKISMFC